MKKLPVALTVAGSDSGGGAGIQADLKTFFSLGVHGTSVITCITAQNPSAVIGIQEVNPEIVAKQLEAVFDGLNPASAKTGMLYSEKIINIVAGFFKERRFSNLVIDPVMVASSGAVLLKNEAIDALVQNLIPLGCIIMPNLDEASVFLKRKITSVEELRDAARELNQRFSCAVLLKGGHLRDLKEAIDIFQDGKTELMLKGTMVKNAQTHGTGCTYSAAVTAFLAKGYNLHESVIAAKKYITRTIAKSVKINKFFALGWDTRRP